MRRLPAGALVALGFAALVFGLAVDARVRLGAFDAVPKLLGAGVAAVALWGVCGYAVAARLLPAALHPWRALLVLPLGAMTSSLALTALGFAHMPIELSLGVVLAAGACTSVMVWRRGEGPRASGPAAPASALAAFAVVGLLAAALSAVPSFRAQRATVPGNNPDAALVTGVAVLLREAPPRSTRLGLPVTRMPDVWKSKYPIFYSLAGVSELSRTDPIEAFPAVAALLVAFVVIGFGLVAICVLGLPPPAGVLVAALLGVDAAVLHLPLHPYWNQLWGLAMLAPALLFAWESVAARDPWATALFALSLLMGLLAYPLMIAYPTLALAAFAVALRRWPALPGRVRPAWAVGVAAGLAIISIPILGVFEKLGGGVGNLVHTDTVLWSGDVTDFFGAGFFFGVGGGALPALGVLAVALYGLVCGVGRPQAWALGALLGIGALADVRLRVADSGAYFDYKHLSFLGPIVVTLAVAGAWSLMARRRTWAVSLGVALLVAAFAASAGSVHRELGQTFDQVTVYMLELREWSDRLPRGASVRLDIAPTGYQVWAGYFLARHPLDSPVPLLMTTYPSVAYGTRADYAVSNGPRLARQLAADGHVVPVSHDTATPPLHANEQFVLRRVVRPRGTETATRRRF